MKPKVGMLFIKLNAGEYDQSEIKFKIEKDVNLFELIEQFNYFVLACGYSFDDGESIKLVKENDESGEVEIKTTNEFDW